jgi:hypothetical protein
MNVHSHSTAPIASKRPTVTTTLAASLATISSGEINTRDLTRIFCYVSNTGGSNPFTGLSIIANTGNDTITIQSAGTDFTSPGGVMVDASGDLTTLGSGTSGWFVMDCLGIDGLDIHAESDLGTTCDFSWSGN